MGYELTNIIRTYDLEARKSEDEKGESVYAESGLTPSILIRSLGA